MGAALVRGRAWHVWTIAVLFYRFATGLHLDGKQRRHLTGKVKPQFHDWYWNRISRPRRAFIRFAVIISIFGTLIGRLEDWRLTEFVLLAVSPFASFWVLRVCRNKVFRKVTSFDSDGTSNQYWTLRPKWAKRIRRFKEFRFSFRQPEGEVVTPGSSLGRSILASNAEDNGPAVTNIRKPVSELIASEAAPHDGRGRTIARRGGRKR